MQIVVYYMVLNFLKEKWAFSFKVYAKKYIFLVKFLIYDFENSAGIVVRLQRLLAELYDSWWTERTGSEYGIETSVPRICSHIRCSWNLSMSIYVIVSNTCMAWYKVNLISCII